jgi:hypothetical protein
MYMIPVYVLPWNVQNFAVKCQASLFTKIPLVSDVGKVKLQTKCFKKNP